MREASTTGVQDNTMQASRRDTQAFRHTLTACLISCLAALPYPVFSAESTAKSTSQTRKKNAAKPKFIDATGETQSQRDKRLLRECKGRPNAGACLGYT